MVQESSSHGNISSPGSIPANLENPPLPISLNAHNQHALKSLTVKDVMTNVSQIHTVTASDPVLVALKQIQKAHVLSLPIVCPDTKRISGFVDTLDVVSFIIKLIQPHINDATTSKNWERLLNLESNWRLVTCGELVSLISTPQFPKLVKYPQLKHYATLSDAISKLVELGRNANRLAVVGPKPDYKLKGIVTQKGLLRNLSTILNHSDPLFKNKIANFDIGTSPVITVNQHSPCYEAFRLCTEHRINGVAVVNEEGKLVGNVSATNIRAFKSLNVNDIVDSCLKPCIWLKRCSMEENFFIPISVQPDMSIDGLISVFVNTGVHHVYLVDEHQKALSVITLRNVISLFKVD